MIRLGRPVIISYSNVTAQVLRHLPSTARVEVRFERMPLEVQPVVSQHWTTHWCESESYHPDLDITPYFEGDCMELFKAIAFNKVQLATWEIRGYRDFLRMPRLTSVKILYDFDDHAASGCDFDELFLGLLLDLQLEANKHVTPFGIGCYVE
ncbi:hypothetical protein HDU98_009444 [Podochytrium sp. JEL0797]|nr:hypothetical protein HDU98_009444 [Podochytrium sp. JEL0797]